MKITFVRAAKSRGYISVGIENIDKKHSFTVSEAVYSECGAPKAADAIDDSVFYAFLRDDEMYRARIKALRILSFGDNSRAALMRKLTVAGFSKDVSYDVVEEMIDCGYINERRKLALLIKDEVNLRFTGPKKLFLKLISKGYSKRDIEAVLSELEENGEIDFSLAKERLIEKKLGKTPEREEVKKLLYKSGYDVC